MKKLLFVTLIGLLILSAVIVSCNSDATGSKLVAVTIGNTRTRGGDFSLDVDVPSTVKWTYKATPKAGEPGIGAVTEETALTLGTTTIYVSKGEWTFEVFGYSTGTNLAYYGKKTQKITGSVSGGVTVSYTKLNTAPDSYSSKTLDNAKIVFGTFTKNGASGSNVITNTDMLYKLDSDADFTTYTDAITVAPGTHTITLKYTDELENTFGGKLVFTASAGYTYTISGSLNTSGLISVTINGSEKEEFKVTFNTNFKAKANDVTVDYTEDKRITAITAPTAEDGYTFAGWNTQADGNGTSYDTGSAVYLTADTNLYAKWVITDPNHFNVTFNTNHKSTSHPDVIIVKRSETTTGETVEILSTPTDDSSYGGFLGWTTTTNGTGTLYKYGESITVTTDTNLYAKWTKGVADVLATSGRSSCGWVQLWENGPKFAEFNVGATIDSYSEAIQTAGEDSHDTAEDPLYCTANVGGLYTWGGVVDSRSTYTNDACSFTYNLPDDNDTAKNIWGDNWKMPNNNELLQLANKQSDGSGSSCDGLSLTVFSWCDGTSIKYQNSNLYGYVVSGKGNYCNNSIFIPTANYYDASFGDYQGKQYGEYWSTSVRENATDYVYQLTVNDGTFDQYNASEKNWLSSVRAILAE